MYSKVASRLTIYSLGFKELWGYFAMHNLPETFTEADHFWMRRALELAELAASKDEVPVGAVLIGHDQKIWSEAHNRREELNTPLGHAELLALDQAARERQSWRLVNSMLYVTLEPCAMCAGALIQSRVERVVFGCLDPKGGAVQSLFQIFDEPQLNHRVMYQGGLLAEESRSLLQRFFQMKRRKKT